MQRWRLITAPTTTPISLQEAKDHLYVTSDSYNGEIKNKLLAAVDYCQRRIPGHAQFCTATYELVLHEFPDSDRHTDVPITLRPPPVQKITSIRYYNSTGGLTYYGSSNGSTASSTTYTLVTETDGPASVEPVFGQTWPATREVPDAVMVRFTAGYASQAALPGSIKEAVKLKLEHLHDPERVDEIKMERAIDSLLAGVGYGHYS